MNHWSTMYRSEFRRRPTSTNIYVEANYSCVFFYVRAVVDGSVIEIGSVLPDKYTLTKLWADIIDICYDTPIRYASTREYKVMLSWSSEYQNMFNDNDMQDAFQKLREKEYRWARFIVNTSIGLKPTYKSFDHPISSNDNSIDFCTPANQVSVNLNLEPDMDWSGFADEEILAKFSALNSNMHPENSVSVLENKISPSSTDDTENVAKYLGNVVPKPSDEESDGSDVYEFRKVIRVFAIRNGFRLKMIKNEKARATARCAKPRCTWRIHASPNWNSNSFQLKTYCPEHTCARDDVNNREASPAWIAAQYLHVFKATPDISVKVIAADMFKKYGFECSLHMLYRAKNKAMELLGQDHEKSYSKLFRYMHALLETNLGSTVSLERDWLGGAANPVFKRFFMFIDGSRRGEGLCFMSDRQKGVLNALEQVFPLALKRAMPVVRMLEEIRRKIMRLIHTRHEASKRWNEELPPLVRRKMVEARMEARGLSVIFGHENTFEVFEDASKAFVVDIGNKKCDCGEWQILGLPCKHAICSIDAKRLKVEDYVHNYLKKTSFLGTYQHQFKHVPDETKWPLVLTDNLQPPLVTKSAGRPQNKRQREADEPVAFKRSCSLRCSRCNHWGHNKRTYQSEKQSSKKRKNGEGSLRPQQTTTEVATSQSTVFDNGELGFL
ncbi:SWIM-type domain-containing protein [Citrus sinensis]|uniref:SWIM-type domain-containing protein n=1 Tax=Citrus sinensis TaxID=2711 RepID=A0ACB8I3Q8_CITSI|nr:SWIM-type domain-containing protein [Citrus sinensis]